jgi:hypothetical protein
MVEFGRYKGVLPLCECGYIFSITEFETPDEIQYEILSNTLRLSLFSVSKLFEIRVAGSYELLRVVKEKLLVSGPIRSKNGNSYIIIKDYETEQEALIAYKELRGSIQEL